MKTLTGKLRTFVKNFLDAIIFGTAAGVVLYCGFCIVMGFIGTLQLSLIESAGVLIGCCVICTVPAILLMLQRSPHQFDPDLIGDSFTGIGKKARIFRTAISAFGEGNYPLCIEILLELERRGLSDKELGVTYFYIGRSYHLMEYFPNALSYYERSAEKGLHHANVKFLIARCTGEMGELERAIDLYSELLSDEKNELRFLIRTDIGRMYMNNDEPQRAMEWLSQAIDLHENYGEALGCAAVCCAMLGDKDADRYCRLAILNGISSPNDFTEYYQRTKAAYKGVESAAKE